MSCGPSSRIRRAAMGAHLRAGVQRSDCRYTKAGIRHTKAGIRHTKAGIHHTAATRQLRLHGSYAYTAVTPTRQLHGSCTAGAHVSIGHASGLVFISVETDPGAKGA